MHAFMPLPTTTESQSQRHEIVAIAEEPGAQLNLSVDSAPLAFIGFARPTTGGNPAVSELLARLFARLVSQRCNAGELPVPRGAALLSRIRADAETERTWFVNSCSCSTLVHPPSFNDAVAAHIGCLVSPWQFAFQPRMLLKWNAATDLPCKYRVVGPGACPSTAYAWLEKARASNSPLRSALLAVLKLLHMTGIAAHEDPVRALRAVGIDLTSKQNRFSPRAERNLRLMIGLFAICFALVICRCLNILI